MAPSYLLLHLHLSLSAQERQRPARSYRIVSRDRAGAIALEGARHIASDRSKRHEHTRPGERTAIRQPRTHLIHTRRNPPPRGGLHVRDAIVELFVDRPLLRIRHADHVVHAVDEDVGSTRRDMGDEVAMGSFMRAQRPVRLDGTLLLSFRRRPRTQSEADAIYAWPAGSSWTQHRATQY
ncbi:hypothetical protein C8J57DRAFT_1510973 [Mycena rebaudengoi]|nr:hypothetical protein C8J57DRAFT_1510973 [Mycena rebaudengoi]